ncbi:MAG TPA: SIMPL domain-containing protein [Aldersonia sp.]
MRRIGVAAAAVALVAGVAGCSANSSGEAPVREVSVVGTGEVRGKPDVLRAEVGVEVSAPDVSGAVSAANERSRAMVDALTAAGVDRADIQTTEVSITPEYSSPGIEGGTATVSGYRATNTVRIVVRDLDNASTVLDDAVAAAGDAARLNGVSFSIDDDTQLLADARARAFEDAKARAQQYADLAGMNLGDVITISESGSAAPTPVERAQADAATPMTIEPGTQTLSFSVSVRWELT